MKRLIFIVRYVVWMMAPTIYRGMDFTNALYLARNAADDPDYGGINQDPIEAAREELSYANE